MSSIYIEDVFYITIVAVLNFRMLSCFCDLVVDYRGSVGGLIKSPIIKLIYKKVEIYIYIYENI